MARKLLSTLLAVMMLTSLLPAGMIGLAGEEDTTLSYLGYTFAGVETQIPLVADDLYPEKQENRYFVELPMVTKTLPPERLPKISAEANDTLITPDIADINAFPGTAKVTVTSGESTRIYYIRFKYEAPSSELLPDGMSVTSSIFGLDPVASYHDFEPLTLPEMRELFNDVGSDWKRYNQLTSNTDINSISSVASATAIPDSGDYITANSWAYGWAPLKRTASGPFTTTYFNGASRIIHASGNRNQQGSGTWMEFEIARSATVWVLGNTALSYYGSDPSWTFIDTTDYNVVESYSTAYSKPYYKRFDAGTVTLPKHENSSNPTRCPVVMIMWDAPGNDDDASLQALSYEIDGIPYTIDIISGETAYRAMVPAGSSVTLSAVPVDDEAEVLITQPAPGSGVAYVDIASGQQTANYTIEFSSLSSDSSLKSLTYTHPMLGKQTIELTEDVTEYNVVLPYGISTQIPQIAAENNSDYAVIESIDQAAAVPGTATVLVSAEDESTSIYTINFSIDQNPPTIDHLPGNVTDVKTRHKNSSSVYDTPQDNDSVYKVDGSIGAPATWFNESSGYATTEEQIAAAMSDNNPYFISSTSSWVYGDRNPTAPGSGAVNGPFRWSTQYVLVDRTSPVLLGEKVTRILSLNAEKDVTVWVPDYYSFHIDKAATVYVAANNTDGEANYIDENWSIDPHLNAQRARTSIVNIEVPVENPEEGEDETKLEYYAIPAGTTTYSRIYAKRYSAGANVTIPNRGSSSSTGILVFIVWDGCNSNTMLSDIKINGSTIEGYDPTSFNYNIELPFGTTEIPTLSATAHFDGATVDVVDPESLPGTATINIYAADGETTGSYTINYSIGIQSGDINADGTIDISDVIIAAEIAVGKTYSQDQVTRANVSNKDDATVDISDVILILERVLGSDIPFPIDL